MMMVIRKAENGYVADHKGIERVFLSLDDLMRHLLLVFEGRCSSFAGESYGSVRIVRHGELSTEDAIKVFNRLA